MKSTDVLVKWTGSKRIQAPEIIKYFPDQIKTYYESFLGGASVLYTLLKSEKNCEVYKCSDLNASLIGIWKLVQSEPSRLFEDYKKHWFELKSKGKEYYYSVRSAFNEDKDPSKFFFLLRTCRNGLVRYNLKKQFTSAFHLGRNGIKPETLKNTLFEWHHLLNENDVRFEVKNYQDIQTKSGDLLYLDPPYALPESRKVVMYYGSFDFENFWLWLRKQKCSYFVSLNGFKNEDDRTVDFPKDLYDEHLLIDNGLNKYDQLCNKRVVARDSLYVRKTTNTI